MYIYMYGVIYIVLYCVGDIKDAARDTNSLYHRKYLLHGWQQAIIERPRGSNFSANQCSKSDRAI